MARLDLDRGFEGGHELMFSSTNALSVSTLGAITGQYGLFGNLGPGGFAIQPFPSALAEFYTGKNIQSTSYSSTGALFGWSKTGTILGSIRQTVGRNLTLYVGTSQVATGTKVLQDNQKYNIQLYIKIADGAGGTIAVKIDDVQDINYASQDTKPGADADVNEWYWGNQAIAVGGGTCKFDDFIVNDTTGGANNSWTGIRYIYPALPTGDSASNNAWSRSTGSNGWSLVDERPYNTTDYVYSNTNGQQQGFTHAASGVPAASVVRSVAFEYIAYKISSGQLKVGARSNTTENLSAAQNLGISPTALRAYYENDPDTSAAWASISAADAAESLVESVI